MSNDPLTAKTNLDEKDRLESMLDNDVGVTGISENYILAFKAAIKNFLTYSGPCQNKLKRQYVFMTYNPNGKSSKGTGIDISQKVVGYNAFNSLLKDSTYSMNLELQDKIDDQDMAFTINSHSYTERNFNHGTVITDETAVVADNLSGFLVNVIKESKAQAFIVNSDVREIRVSIKEDSIAITVSTKNSSIHRTTNLRPKKIKVESHGDMHYADNINALLYVGEILTRIYATAFEGTGFFNTINYHSVSDKVLKAYDDAQIYSNQYQGSLKASNKLDGDVNAVNKPFIEGFELPPNTFIDDIDCIFDSFDKVIDNKGNIIDLDEMLEAIKALPRPLETKPMSKEVEWAMALANTIRDRRAKEAAQATERKVSNGPRLDDGNSGLDFLEPKLDSSDSYIDSIGNTNHKQAAVLAIYGNEIMIPNQEQVDMAHLDAGESDTASICFATGSHENESLDLWETRSKAFLAPIIDGSYLNRQFLEDEPINTDSSDCKLSDTEIPLMDAPKRQRVIKLISEWGNPKE